MQFEFSQLSRSVGKVIVKLLITDSHSRHFGCRFSILLFLHFKIPCPKDASYAI